MMQVVKIICHVIAKYVNNFVFIFHCVWVKGGGWRRKWLMKTLKISFLVGSMSLNKMEVCFQL